MLGSRIDAIESSAPAADETVPNAADKAAGRERAAAMKARAFEAETAGKSPSEQLALVLAALQADATTAACASRRATGSEERLQRALQQKRQLELLSKELQSRNKKLAEELRQATVEQAKMHAATQAKFSASLADIQKQIDASGSERAAQAADSEKLRGQLAQLLEYDAAREKHFAQQLKTKELELQLESAKLAQATEFASAEASRADSLASKVDALLKLETQLREQLSQYGNKFEEVQGTLSKSNELFGSFKSEMERSGATLRKLEKDKMELERQAAKSKLQLIQAAEERLVEQRDADKLKRQNQVLTTLCKQLQAKNSSTVAATSAAADDSAASKPPDAANTDTEAPSA
jgi:chromosome segregation ATPase